MGRRRIEMFQFRQVLVRLRAGDRAREIARSGMLGRDELTELTRLAQAQGWLDPRCELPDDATIATALAPSKRASSTVSSVEPLPEVVQRWFDAGVQGSAIHTALKREHAFTGSHSAVRRMLLGMRAAVTPEATVRLSFAPADAAQVDFGAGPVGGGQNPLLFGGEDAVLQLSQRQRLNGSSGSIGGCGVSTTSWSRQA